MAITFELFWKDLRDTPRFNSLTILLGLTCLYALYVLIYGLFICPTRRIPGPILARFTTAYYHAIFFGGSMSMTIHELHKKYGISMFSHIKARSRCQNWPKQNQCESPGSGP